MPHRGSAGPHITLRRRYFYELDSPYPIVAALALLLPSTASAVPATAADRDCSDFSSQAAAQAYFLGRGGPAADPDRLDADGDGIACESLPGPYSYSTTPTQPTTPSQPATPVQPGTPAPCAPAEPVGLHFTGLPGSLVIGRRAYFAVDDRIEAFVSGTARVQMLDEQGHVFADAQLATVIDEAWVMLDLGNRSVQIVATAVEEHLDGTSCTRTISQTVTAQNRIYFPSRCTNPRYRPVSIIVACGDGNLQLRELGWRHWDSAVARARGVALANDCVPYCARGRFHRLPANVKLYARKYCANIERYVYTKLRYRFRGRLPSWLGRRTGAAPFPCRMYD